MLWDAVHIRRSDVTPCAEKTKRDTHPTRNILMFWSNTSTTTILDHRSTLAFLRRVRMNRLAYLKELQSVLDTPLVDVWRIMTTTDVSV
jgi:hypothetical protein